jgi:hypothetical protein
VNCKHCNMEVLNRDFGLRDFCSLNCREEYRRIYHAKAKRKSRQIKNMMSISYPTDVDTANPYELTILRGGENESETLYEDYGGKSWYSFAKRECCNFYVREKEGYCVKLFEPRNTFRCKCNECSLGKDLMNKAKEAKKKARK